MKHLFVFDLDSTITRCELLPLIAREAGLEAEMAVRTEQAMWGGCAFEEDFRRRVELLRPVAVRRAAEIAAQAPVDPEIAAFLREHRDRCMILTGNLNVWIAGLVARLGMEGKCISSRASVKDGYIAGVDFVLDKARAAASLSRPFIAIGDGSNDIGMFRVADYAVACSIARPAPAELLAAADAEARSAAELCSILKKFL